MNDRELWGLDWDALRHRARKALRPKYRVRAETQPGSKKQTEGKSPSPRERRKRILDEDAITRWADED